MAAATVVIPARFGSTRFPAKIIANETGRPLVQHVVDSVRKCRRVREIIVATDDARIQEALRPFGTRCVMTDPAHPSGTDRIAEVARGLDDDVVINVQGDEPEIEPETVDALVERLTDHDDDMATVATRWPRGADPRDPNLVKVVLAESGHALYFSRSPIPFPRDREGWWAAASNELFLLHLGVYAFRRTFLLEYAAWEPTSLERTEKLEQLRAVQRGRRIFVLTVERATHGIDTPEQYQAFVNRYRGRQAAVQGPPSGGITP